MFHQDLYKKIQNQKQQLVSSQPNLEHFFVPIQIPNLGSVPFLPIRSFRDFCLFTGDPQDPSHTTFLSSGSTNEKRARHLFSQKRLEQYAEKSTEHFLIFLNRHGFDKSTRIISLIPPPEVWRDSSLARMIFMLQSKGFCIQYADVQDIPSLSHAYRQEDVLVFGTTFHHFLVADATSKNPLVWNQHKQKKWALIDTGGTKGRMITHTPAETQKILWNAYGNPEHFLFLSEYGMCELGSQAWSANTMHDGSFFAASTLFPFSICLKTRCALPENHRGFLGFIDTINLQESYPAIITEDIGVILDLQARLFQFHHRAPHASVKGCSLNIKENFKFSLDDGDKETTLCVQSNEINTKDVEEQIKKQIWFSNDLEKSIASFEDVKVANPQALKGKHILIICSANMPITWLYPTKIASLMGARSVHIKLPSLRDNDPLSETIQHQIHVLLEKFGSSFLPTEVVVHKNSKLSDRFDAFDHVVVFGTNATIQTFQTKLQDTKTKLIPQGEIQNSLDVTSNDSFDHVAQLCSLWFGRGCLTPVCLFMDQDDFDERKTKEWISGFSACLEKHFLSRYADALDNFNKNTTSLAFLHDHNGLHTESILKQFGFDVGTLITKLSVTCVVNLIPLANDHLSHMDFSFGGCGFVFILNSSQKKQLLHITQTTVTPQLGDPHGGKTWEAWFGGLS